MYEGTPGVAPTVNENGEILGGSGTDITDFFLFDDGQRDSLYDTAALVRKPGSELPLAHWLSVSITSNTPRVISSPLILTSTRTV